MTNTKPAPARNSVGKQEATTKLVRNVHIAAAPMTLARTFIGSNSGINTFVWRNDWRFHDW
jgi:hypothetical protein